MQNTYWLEKLQKIIFSELTPLSCIACMTNMLQRAQRCMDVQEDHFQHLLYPGSTLHLHLFNFLYRVRDIRRRWSTRRRAGFSCAILFKYKSLPHRTLKLTAVG